MHGQSIGSVRPGAWGKPLEKLNGDAANTDPYTRGPPPLSQVGDYWPPPRQPRLRRSQPTQGPDSSRCHLNGLPIGKRLIFGVESFSIPELRLSCSAL